MMRLQAALACALFVGLRPCAGVQRVDYVGDSVGCPQCTIEMALVATMGGSTGLPGEARGYDGLVTWSGGRLVAFSQFPGRLPLVFDRRGRFLYPLGSHGRGPGEFSHPGAAARGPGDSLYIYDYVGRRISVLDPQGQVLRSFAVPLFVFRMAALSNGDLVVNALVRSPDRIGYPLATVHPDGTLGPSYGAENPSFHLRDQTRLYRILVPFQDGVWAINTGYRYRLEYWRSDGALQRVIERQANWFPPYEQLSSYGDGPPPPEITASWLDPRGRLWVIGNVPGVRWQQAFRGTVRDESGREVPRLVDHEAYWDGMIEVIDLTRRRVVARSRVPQRLIRMTDDGLVARFRENEDGAPLIDLYRLTLRGE